MKPKHVQIRIHESWSGLKDEPIIKKLISDSQRAFAFEHPADQKVKRTHCHIYLFDIDLTVESVRERLKKKWEANREFSASGGCGKDKRPIDEEGAWTYGTKPALLRPVMVNLFSPERVKELESGAAAYWAKADTSGNSTSTAIKTEKVKKLTKYAMIKEIVCEVLTPDFVKMSHEDPERIRIVKRTTLEYLRKNQVFCGVLHATDYIECVLMDLNDDSFTHAVDLRLQRNLGIIF